METEEAEEPLTALESLLFLLLHTCTHTDITPPPMHTVCKLGESSPKWDYDNTLIPRRAVLRTKKNVCFALFF